MKTFTAFLIVVILVMGCKKNDPVTNTSDTPVSPPANQEDTTKFALINHYYTPGNLEAGGLDTFTLEFNRTVKVTNILLVNNPCSPNLKYNVTNGGNVVKFYNFLCGGLGEQYAFQYSITDTLGNQLIDTATFNCYTRKISLKGSPVNYFISDDNKFCWVITNSPNQILCLGISDTTIKKSYDLSFEPRNAVYNYYNNRIYIFSSPGDFSHREYIYVMNPENGKIEKTLQIPYDFSNKPLFAESLAFGSNGFGIVICENDNSSETWLMIDSKQNDSMYVDSVNYYLYSFRRLYTNFDKTKIIALQQDGNCRFGIIDCFSHSITELSTPVSPVCYNSYIAVNKMKDQFFVVNLQTTGYGQFIISNNTMTGADTNFDAYNGSEADFSYRPGENNYIYYFDSHVFGIVDYNTGNVLMNTDFAYNLKKIVATTDGKYIVCTDINSIVFFDTKIFYQNL